MPESFLELVQVLCLGVPWVSAGKVVSRSASGILLKGPLSYKIKFGDNIYSCCNSYLGESFSRVTFIYVT